MPKQFVQMSDVKNGWLTPTPLSPEQHPPPVLLPLLLFFLMLFEAIQK